MLMTAQNVKSEAKGEGTNRAGRHRASFAEHEIVKFLFNQ
jgi:hypothetical protein